MDVFFESADVARTLDVVPASIRYHVRLGHIQPAARTLRGGALFRERDVEELRRHLRGQMKRPRSV